jgi:hypothetical protein
MYGIALQIDFVAVSTKNEFYSILHPAVLVPSQSKILTTDKPKEKSLFDKGLHYLVKNSSVFQSF